MAQGTNSKLTVLGTGKAVEIVTGVECAATKEFGQKDSGRSD